MNINNKHTTTTQRRNLSKRSELWLRLKPRNYKVFSSENMNAYRQRFEYSWKILEEGCQSS